MRPSATFAVLALLASPPLQARNSGLTVKTGESLVFSIQNGHPVRAQKVAASAKPKSGQVLVTVRSMMGTTMTIISNNPIAYTYRAELLGADKFAPIRSCTLPANGRLSFENWPQRATAIRLSDFKPARKDGSCP